MGNCCECLGREKPSGPQNLEGISLENDDKLVVGPDGKLSAVGYVGTAVEVSPGSPNGLRDVVSDPEASSSAGGESSVRLVTGALGFPYSGLTGKPNLGGASGVPWTPVGGGPPSFGLPSPTAPVAPISSPHVASGPADWGPPPGFEVPPPKAAPSGFADFAAAALSAIGITEPPEDKPTQRASWNSSQPLLQSSSDLQQLQIPQLSSAGPQQQQEGFHSARSDVSGLTMETLMPVWSYFAR